MNRVIFVCGEICAGKTTFADKLALEYNGFNCDWGTDYYLEISSYVKMQANGSDRASLQATAELDEKIISYINTARERVDERCDLYVVGPRQLSIIKAFKQAECIWLYVDETVRFLRWLSRKDSKDPDKKVQTWEEALLRDEQLGLKKIREYIFKQSKTY